MLNVALVGLLAGSLSLATPGTGGDEKKTPNADKPAAEATAPEASASVFGTPEALTEDDVQSLTQDTYAYGFPSDVAPIKLWVQYGLGFTSAEQWDTSGDDATVPFGEVKSQRIGVGAQVNLISFPAFKFGVGSQLNVAGNNAEDNGMLGPFALQNSDFGLQQLKVYGTARGRVVGVHGGYIFDFGDEAVLDPAAGTYTLGNSDGRNALMFGADFDYPSEVVRLFGGVDYFHLARDSNDASDAEGDDDIWNFLMGAGVKFSIVEVGAALQIQTRMAAPTNTAFGSASGLGVGQDGVGGHAGTVAPYLRLSPPSLPASLFIKGAVLDEYTEYGYAIGGANSPKPKVGFTAGLTIGFE